MVQKSSKSRYRGGRSLTHNFLHLKKLQPTTLTTTLTGVGANTVHEGKQEESNIGPNMLQAMYVL